MRKILLSLIIFMPMLSSAETMSIDTSKSTLTWLGKKVSGEHNGTVAIKSGNIVYEDSNITGGEFVLDMTSIKNKDIESETYKKKLEDHLKSDDFFNVSQYPEGKFVIKGSKLLEETPEGQKMEIIGTLTIKDKSNLVSFPAIVKKTADGKLAGMAKTSIDRTRWDIRYNSKNFFDPAELGDKLIYNDIEIGLNLETL